MTVKTLKRTALAAYFLAGIGLTTATYTLASVQTNLNTIRALQTEVEDQEKAARHKREETVTARAAAGLDTQALDARPYPTAPDWADIAAQVMPSMVMLSIFPEAQGDGSKNKAWLVPGVKSDYVSIWLTKYRAGRLYGKRDAQRAWETNGAGFFVDGSTVMTAAHVVEGSEAVRVQLHTGEWRTAKVDYFNAASDLATLKVEGEPVQPVATASTLPRQGHGVAAIGAPSGRGFSISTGIVSRYGMDGGLYKEAETMQIDAPIFGGNSGGAVVNAHGEAVGIVSYGSVSFTQSIPISSALAEIAKH